MWWPVVLGLVVLYVPTYVDLHRIFWGAERGTQGPVILVLAAWLIWRERMLFVSGDLKTSPAAGITLFAIGLLFSFIAAWLCVRWLLRYIATHDFVPFAWYRIAFGILVLATWWTGTVVWAE